MSARTAAVLGLAVIVMLIAASPLKRELWGRTEVRTSETKVFI
jgi:hypothetical protein